MKTFKKLLALLMVLMVLVSCAQTNNQPTNETEVGKETETPEETIIDENGVQLTIQQVNQWLNTSADIGPGTKANAIAVVPINHIDGPREENTFYAFVNFKYKARNFIKYQISYVSCTCRSADVNIWQTAYVELSLPESGKIDDAEIKFLSFDEDSTGKYTGGFWGDSNPTPAGHTYEDFKEQYIPFFQGKSLGYVYNLSTMDDIDAKDYATGEGREDLKVDFFSSSSVSTNNIIRMIHAIGRYHASDEYFADDTRAQELAANMNGAKGEMPVLPEGNPDAPAGTIDTTAPLPAPVDTTKEYKPNKDSEELEACEVGNYSADCSSINKDNLLEYMNRVDTVYIDLRDYKDTQLKHFRNFEVVPFFGLIYNKEAQDNPDSVQLFGGDTKAPIPMYEESTQLLEEIFPRDKNIVFVCQSGGRVAMMMDILQANGYDMTKVYNAGGIANYTDAKYTPYIVDTLEFEVTETYSIEGLTRATDLTPMEAKEVKEVEVEPFTATKADSLPAPVDTTRQFKADKDSDELSNCEAGSHSADCSSINKDNLLEYLGREDTVYIDLRDYKDVQQKRFRNFEPVPFFGLVYNKDATEGSEHVQLFGGDTKNPIARYPESEELLNVMFPKTKYIVFVCQSGGRVGMMMDILEANGYDMTKIYNAGGIANYTDSMYESLVVDTIELQVQDTYNILLP